MQIGILKISNHHDEINSAQLFSNRNPPPLGSDKKPKMESKWVFIKDN